MYSVRVNLPSSIAAGLALTLVVATPVTVRAQETASPLPAIVTNVFPATSLVSPIGARLASLGAQSAEAPRLLFAGTPEEIRLSRGAKTALIITAIVVGCLIIVGVVVVSRPGHL